MDNIKERKTPIRGLKSSKSKSASEEVVKHRFKSMYGKWPTQNELRQFQVYNPISSSLI